MIWRSPLALLSRKRRGKRKKEKGKKETVSVMAAH
jgi:hypothetical protein